ncbi:MAG: CRTAC1 family protein [Gemmatimonadetes bacterium]|nr:CRTAC1 family protein [Gemmatimonadota bacterium]
MSARLWTVLAGVVAVGSVACGGDVAPGGNEAVVEELRMVYAETSPYNNPYLNDRRVALIRGLPTPPDRREQWALTGRLADELLWAGDTRAALELFGSMEATLDSVGSSWEEVDGLRAQLDSRFAIAWLRLGEQENCVANPTSAACVVPIDTEGWHELEEGSRNAIVYLGRMLERAPDDLNARWLLNLAHMTLGEYPAGVPEVFRIPPEVFRSEADIGRFWDIGAHLGVDVRELSGGALTDDFDGDGRLDLMTSSWHLQDQIRLFRNEGDGTFTEVTDEAGLTGITGGLNMQQADFDNDGDVDVFVLRGAWMGEEGLWPNSLLRNDGDGTFTDVTGAAGLAARHPTQTAVWADLDLDGRLDLYIGNETRGEPDRPNELYLNNGDGTFREVARAAGVAAVGFVKGVDAGDVDNDGRPDLYVSRLGQPNLLFMNQGVDAEGGVPTFVEASDRAGVREPLESFPTWFFDVDNDGWLDLFVAGYRADPGAVLAEWLGRDVPATLPRLYRNDGDGTFTDVTEAYRLDRFLYAMGSNFGDLDNDGWLDMLVGTGDPDFAALMPNRAFRNDGGTGFQEVTVSGGFGNVQKGHAVAFGDVNDNGDQDIYMNLGGALEGDEYGNAFYANPGHGHRWLTLRLRGTRSNRLAQGARVTVVVEQPDGSTREIHRVVDSGGSFGGNSLQTEIGLGMATGIVAVEVRWPVEGSEQRFTGLELDSAYELHEAEDAPRAVELRPFAWPTGLAPARAGEHDHPGGAP